MRVEATEDAAAVVERVKAERTGRLTITIGNGCCESTAPYLYESHYAGPDAEAVGEAAGVEILAPAWLRDLYPDDTLVMAVERTACADSFSLEADLGCRFTLEAAPPTNP